MATSLLALLDDITTLLDDVAVLTKIATKKTAGVLGDDLALNAQQVSGVSAQRELPVVWAVARGSMLNKAILVPAALAISAWAPWLITPLLMLGGAFLCFEGAEKLAHRWLHSAEVVEAEHAKITAALVDEKVDLRALEHDKIKGAVRTDFILSAEIIAITLGTVAAETLLRQAAVLATVAVLITIGVYGLVAAIVKIDDLGLWMSRRPGRAAVQAVGRFLVRAAPRLMQTLTIVGTAAMFLVGGGILLHGLAPLNHLVQGLIAQLASWPGFVLALLPTLADGLTGLVAGAILVPVVQGVQRLRGGAAAAARRHIECAPARRATGRAWCIRSHSEHVYKQHDIYFSALGSAPVCAPRPPRPPRPPRRPPPRSWPNGWPGSGACAAGRRAAGAGA